MRKLKFKLDQKSIEIMYVAFIRTILEYVDVIWDNCARYEKNEIEKIQLESARIITATPYQYILTFFTKKLIGIHSKNEEKTTNSHYSSK